MEALPPTVCHSFHQKHELRIVITRPSGFVCGGCKQFGRGPEHYRCEECDFDLHARCATAPAVVDNDLFESSRFTLADNHTTQTGDMFCHACGGESVGFRYHNPDLKFYLHPCCASLPKRVVQDGHTFELGNDESGCLRYHKCRLCKERSPAQSLSYRCNYRGGGHVYLHVKCLASGHNEQTGHTNWQPSAPIMEGVLGKFTRKREKAKAVLRLGKVAGAVVSIVGGVLAVSNEL